MEFPSLQHHQFIDVTTLSTLTGASLGVMLVANVAHYVFDWNPRWFGLLMSLVISIGLTLTTEHGQLIDWVVCLVKAFQIYATAVGIAAISARKNPRHKIGNPQKDAVLNGAGPKAILAPWY